MPLNSAQKLGDLLRDAREAAGLSQGALGKLLQPPRSHAAISDMERGQTRIGATDIAQFARLLERPVAYFYGESDTPKSRGSAIYGRGDLTKDIADEFSRKVKEILTTDEPPQDG